MKRWKDECDGCLTYQYDCHSYEVDGKILILCPNCAQMFGVKPRIRSEFLDLSKATYLSDKDCQQMQLKGWQKIKLDKENLSVSVENYKKVRLYYNGKKTERTYFLLVR